MQKFEKKDYKYFLYFLYIPVYAIWFGLLEKHIITGYFVSFLPLDNIIPFCEYFYIFYFTWYFYLAFITIFLLLTKKEDFAKFMQFIIIGATTGLIIFTFFPNGQNLRPTAFLRDNIFTKCIGFLYSIDTNTNVLPSLHVVGAIGGAIAILKSNFLHKKHFLKIFTVILCSLICLSTVFIKQHSVLDFYSGAALCVIVYFVVYSNILKYIFFRFNKNKKVKLKFYK